MTTLDLNDLCRRVINSSNRLQQLSEMRAPDIVMRTENLILEDAISALLEDEDIAEITDNIGASAFINTFNHIAGTEIRVPISATASSAA